MSLCIGGYNLYTELMRRKTQPQGGLGGKMSFEDELAIEDDGDDFMNFQEPPVGNRLERLSTSQKQLENVKEATKAEVERAKIYRESRFVGMSELAMDALEMGLQSEDEGVRMKALAMYLDRTVSRVGIDRSGEEVIEVVNPATKMVADEIEKLIAKKIEDSRNSNGAE